jgi:hypothetical protein
MSGMGSPAGNVAAATYKSAGPLKCEMELLEISDDNNLRLMIIGIDWMSLDMALVLLRAAGVEHLNFNHFHHVD